jgi:hypothetical protein
MICGVHRTKGDETLDAKMLGTRDPILLIAAHTGEKAVRQRAMKHWMLKRWAHGKEVSQILSGKD